MSQLLILASGSPRRQQILKEAGYTFEVVNHDLEEIIPAHVSPSGAAEYLSKDKNDKYRQKIPEGIIITADTTVLTDDQMLGKPTDEQEAVKMLTVLSGKTHRVRTGFTISDWNHSITEADTTEVTFGRLEPEEIRHYTHHFRPLDKAGAYGIQEWIGMIGIQSIKGSYFNVVGLPIHLIYQTLKNKFDLLPATFQG